MSQFRCSICTHVYDEENEPLKWQNRPDNWLCPICGSPDSAFTEMEIPPVAETLPHTPDEDAPSTEDQWHRACDEYETHMALIHAIATTGESVIEPMRTRVPVFSWDEILIKGAQLARQPLNKDEPVSTTTTIGPRAARPLVIETPMFVTHMSFGALSREAHIALARGSARAKTAMCSGEGGILPDARNDAYRYIFEYVPNKYSVTDEYLAQIDAVEIKIGQSAKPGMGGHLPGSKVTAEIAKIRGIKAGADCISPSRFPDIRSRDDLKKTVAMLREKTHGKPIGIKMAAGHLEDDIPIALYADVDFITLDGRAGGTGAAPKVVKDATSLPTIFGLDRARTLLDAADASHVSLIVTGGFRVSSDCAKALAMGADAIALGTAVMMALGCQQYRICHTGMCPRGIATQDPTLRKRLDIDAAAERVYNYFNVCTKELKTFARLTGRASVHDLHVTDLCTTHPSIAQYTQIAHV